MWPKKCFNVKKRQVIPKVRSGSKSGQHIHYSKSDLDYTLDVNQVFDNLYAETNEEDLDDEKE